MAYLKQWHQKFTANWFEVTHSLGLVSVTPSQSIKYFKKTTLVELVANHLVSDSYASFKNDAAVAFIVMNSTAKLVQPSSGFHNGPF